MDGTRYQPPESLPAHRTAGIDINGRAARPARLAARNLSWGPPDTPSVLDDASFNVEPGKLLGIVGPNGAGKSTLLRLIYRYYRPRSGQIFLDGQDIWKLPAGLVARDLAVVLQERPAEFSLTVREIVALGRLPHRRRAGADGIAGDHIVHGAMERLGVLKFRDRLLGTLSGGEQQRVAIARALAQEPRILVLDEPTNQLDIRHQLETLSLLQELGLTVVCSLHDLNTAIEIADLVLVLAQGRSLAYGRPQDVLSPELISAAFSVNARIDRLAGSGRQQFSFEL